jgi:hypothetical protein
MLINIAAVHGDPDTHTSGDGCAVNGAAEIQGEEIHAQQLYSLDALCGIVPYDCNV